MAGAPGNISNPYLQTYLPTMLGLLTLLGLTAGSVGLYFTTTLFTALVASPLVFALGIACLSLVALGLSIAVFFAARAIFKSVKKHKAALPAKPSNSPLGKANKPLTGGSGVAAKNTSYATPAAGLVASPFAVFPKFLYPKIAKTTDNKTLISLADTCQAFRGVFGGLLKRPKLAWHAKLGDTKIVEAILKQNPEALIKRIPGFNRQRSPLYAAAWGGHEAIYNKFVTKLKEKHKGLNKNLYQLMYFVITGLENKEPLKSTEQLQAQTYLRKLIESNPGLYRELIFTPCKHIGGLTPLQMAAAELDIHMLLALLLPLTDNPEEVREALAKIVASSDTPEEKWQSFMETIMQHLPEDLQRHTAEQLKAVQDNHWLIDPEPLVSRYKTCLDLIDKARKTRNDEDWDAADTAWLSIGPEQGKFSRALLLDAYFHPISNEKPRHYCETARAGEYKFWDDKLLFTDDMLCRLISSMGGAPLTFSIMRAWRERAVRVAGRGAAPPSVRLQDVSAVTRLFKVKTQQLNKIIHAVSPSAAPSHGL